ncbi:hypothetical protein ACFL34_01640 [Candidatus Sumerlaeota bacterium]
MPEVGLTRDAADRWTWSATFNAPLDADTYTLAIYATYPDAASDKLSEPVFTGLIVVADQ